jgi:hypothetical protein
LGPKIVPYTYASSPIINTMKMSSRPESPADFAETSDDLVEALDEPPNAFGRMMAASAAEALSETSGTLRSTS